MPALLFDDAREIAGREVLLVGIKRNVALAFIVLEKRDEEILEDTILRILRLGFYVLGAGVVKKKFMEHGLCQR